ncbi:uncharacterized protein LOC122850006 isoform X2 [Aphidius gifuensis]|nr:uncharacterized protein LOC122850006 isoform X2 [Aphidius gifuensis]
MVILLLTLATIITASPLAIGKDLDDDNNQHDTRERYAWNKPQVQVYRTMDLKDFNDPRVGVLRDEDIPEYQAGIPTMDLSVLESQDKLDNPNTRDNNVEETIVNSHNSENYKKNEKSDEKEEKVITIFKNVEVPYEVEKIQHVPIVKKIPYEVKIHVPQPYAVEKQVPVPYKVYIKVPSYIPAPYAIEKKIPYAVHVPIERKVPYRVYVPKPIPVERKSYYQVKIPSIEPYPIERQIPINIKIPTIVHQPIPIFKEKPVPFYVNDSPASVMPDSSFEFNANHRMSSEEYRENYKNNEEDIYKPGASSNEPDYDTVHMQFDKPHYNNENKNNNMSIRNKEKE